MENAHFKKTIFSVPKMDCPSEERMIRLALQGDVDPNGLTFDLQNRILIVVHEVDANSIFKKLEPLNYGAVLSSTETISSSEAVTAAQTSNKSEESRVLKAMMRINGFMFIVELTFGLWSQSTGLIADSLDMFADASVYGISLYAVAKSLEHQRRSARVSGYLQLLLAAGALAEVARRFIFGSEPQAPMMMSIAFLALIANVACLWLISKHRDGGVHMKASWIFSTNDVIANTGVILAGGLVYLLGSPIPDLVIGGLIAVVVFRGAISILRISKKIQANT